MHWWNSPLTKDGDEANAQIDDLLDKTEGISSVMDNGDKFVGIFENIQEYIFMYQLYFIVFVIILVAINNDGLYLYINDDGNLVAYDFIVNGEMDLFIGEYGLMKFIVNVGMDFEPCMQILKDGTCIEFTVTKGQNDDYDITYVVFENGVKVPDKFNLKRFKSCDSVIDI